MKKVLYVLVGLFALAAYAHGEDQVPLDFKVISVEDSHWAATGVKIDVKDIKKGIFVTGTRAGGLLKAATDYPKTTELLREIFKSRGLKVVDKPEDADVGIQFMAGNRFPGFEGVEQDMPAATPGSSTALALVTGTIYAKLTHGGMLPIAGSEFDAKKNGVGDVVIDVVRNPKLTGRGKLDGDDSHSILSVITIHMNRLPTKEEHYTAVLLTADVTGFIDQHFVGLPAQAPVAGSGVPATAVEAASSPVAAK